MLYLFPNNVLILFYFILFYTFFSVIIGGLVSTAKKKTNKCLWNSDYVSFSCLQMLSWHVLLESRLLRNILHTMIPVLF